MTDGDADVARTLLTWYAENARDLPWRRPGVTPWGVLVSEVMLQQTPAARVAPAWVAWLARWPTPAALAAEPPGEAIRMWGRLGYPRRALRLHAAAVAIDRDHDGQVPGDAATLHTLPGVGHYTAAAVACFGFGRREAVLDTNVRRVWARFVDGSFDVAAASPTVAERAAALHRVPADDPAGFGVAVMELGALVCQARSPRCEACPLVRRCRWVAAGRPGPRGVRRAQPYAGTDRQVRGRLLAVLRAHDGPVSADDLAAVWDEPVQRDRALTGLLEDGLVVRAVGDRLALP